jgi:hypothetical protein
MAEKTGARHDDLTRQFEEALARKRRHDETCAAHAARKTQMLDALGTDTLPDAALRIDQALERKQLGHRVSQIATELCETLGVTSLEEARSRLSAAGADELDAERQELEASLETLDAEIQHLFAARTRASDALDAVGGDDAVARIEQRRRTTLEAIAEGAERYLRLSAGVIAMEQALTLYRERHSSSMMQRASEAIRTISRGRYTGLASQPNNGNELLIAIQNDGTSKQAAEMSKGARFQLYLAPPLQAQHHRTIGQDATFMISFNSYASQWTGNIRGDILSGLVVALALIPEAIAFSIIAGVDPKVGLYASFSIAVITAIVGGRPGMISAATAATAVLMVTLVKEHGLEYLLAATVLAGLIQIAPASPGSAM